MSDLPNPINRYEKYLNAIATGNSDDLPTPPITREEVFLDYIARNGGGSGSGEVTGVKGNAESNYRKGNVNITPENIGLGNVNNTSDANKPVSTAQQTALDGKVDKVTGKGLSTNDYDNTAKGIVDGVTTALAGKANSSDLGDKSNLTTTDKSSVVAAINELVSGASLHDIGNDYTFADLTAEQKVTWFTNWTDNVNFPVLYGSGVLVPGSDLSQKCIIYVIIGANGNGEVYTNTYRHGAWEKWNGLGLTYGVYPVNNATDVKDFIKKAIQQAHTDLANKKAYTLYNILAAYDGVDHFYGTLERQDTAGYAFSLSKATGDSIYQGYYDISTDHMNVFRFDGTAI